MPVLATKLHAPVPRRDLVARHRLTDQLVGQHPRLVLASAPAGFGKTTLLTQWLTVSPDPDTRVAWLSLDDADNDPRRFLEHLVAALGPADGTGLLASGAAQPAIEAALTQLVNDLELRSGRTVLALDDYHVISAPDVHRAVTFLLDHFPPNATLAIATRADPPLPLPRLRTRGELVELRAGDLRFTPEEAGAFLADVMGLDLNDAQVSALESRTEGWVAGLQLAGLSLRGVDDATGFVDAFTGTHRFVLDYLVEEVLRHQPEPVRRFLLDTAVLRHLTGPLCDAVTGADEGEGTAMLESLDRANLFVVPLDDERRWYRYHHLFADALRARLGAAEPARVPVLHRSASQWYAVRARPEDAIRHALAGDDPERAAALVERALPDVRRDRRDRVVRDWLLALPDEAVRRRALLATYRGWVQLVEGDLAGVEAWLGDAERALAVGTPVAAPDASDAAREELRTLPATIEIFRAAVAQARGDTEATAAHARRALESSGPDDHMARAGALGFLGLGAWGRGDLAEAVDTFSEAVRSMAAAGDVADEFGSTVVLADLWVGRGRPDEARRLLERALTKAMQHPGAALPTLGDLQASLADVLVEVGDLEAAEHHLVAARSLGESASLLENRHRWFVASARLHRARGDLDAAVEALDQAERTHVAGFFPDVRPIAAQRARVWIAQGRLEDAWDWARERGARATETPGHLDEYDQLTLVWLLLAQHHDGLREGDAQLLDEAATRLDRLTPGATAGGRGGTLAEVEKLRALLSAVERDPGGGELDRALGRTAYRKPLGDREPTATDGLSERELDVLRLLGSTLSGPDIARELFVSVNTLRTHTKHIFTKLDVNTRRAAVERARERGLL